MSGLPAPTPVIAAACLAVASVGAGCGSTRVLSGDRTLEISLTEYRLVPDSVRVSAGPMTIIVHNFGRLTHNLVVSLGGQVEGATKPVGPGQSTEMTVTLTRGRYMMASTILSDQALGAYGTLTVA